MKIRSDFVTNSSSSSFIICFARIEDEEKAKKVIEKYALEVYNAEEVNAEKNWSGELGADWCDAVIYGVDKVLAEHPDSNYVIITDSNEAGYDEDSWEPVYDYDFEMNAAIDAITTENGFADIDTATGEGRDG